MEEFVTFAQSLASRMKQMKSSVADISYRTEAEPEVVRSILEQGSYPSPYLLRRLYDVLTLDYVKMIEVTKIEKIAKSQASVQSRRRQS